MGLAWSWLYAAVYAVGSRGWPGRGLTQFSVFCYTVGSWGWPGCGFTQLLRMQSVRGVGLIVAIRSGRYAVGSWG